MTLYFRIFLKKPKSVFASIDSKSNGQALLLKTILRHWNCFLSSVATDGSDGNGLKRFDAMSSKITKKIMMVSSPWQNPFNIFLVVLQEHFVYE